MTLLVVSTLVTTLLDGRITSVLLVIIGSIVNTFVFVDIDDTIVVGHGLSVRQLESIVASRIWGTVEAT